MNQNFFIKPSGAIVPVVLHIEYLVAHPEEFDLTLEEIQQTYDKYGETFGREGQARDELLINAFKRGWIRVNYFDRNDRYTINGWALNNNLKNLQNFALDAATGKVTSMSTKFSDVMMQFFKDNSTYVTTVSDLMSGKVSKFLERMLTKLSSNSKLI